MSEYRGENGKEGKGILFVISSASGGGKTTLVGRLLGALPDLAVSVSHTTRLPRPGEVDGRDYHFISTDEFQRMVGENEFIEWANVYEELYGTSEKAIQTILDDGWDVLLDIDVQGGTQIRERFPDSVLVFIVPPGRDELERRLLKRGTETQQEIDIRMAQADKELALIPFYDYAIANENIDAAADALMCVVVAERCKAARSSK